MATNRLQEQFLLDGLAKRHTFVLVEARDIWKCMSKVQGRWFDVMWYRSNDGMRFTGFARGAQVAYAYPAWCPTRADKEYRLDYHVRALESHVADIGRDRDDPASYQPFERALRAQVCKITMTALDWAPSRFCL